jgi:hypothetical protein
MEVNPVLQVSAVRRVGDENEIRVWNPTDVAVPLACTQPGWQRVSASPSDVPHDLVAPHQIATFRRAR